MSTAEHAKKYVAFWPSATPTHLGPGPGCDVFSIALEEGGAGAPPTFHSAVASGDDVLGSRRGAEVGRARPPAQVCMS